MKTKVPFEMSLNGEFRFFVAATAFTGSVFLVKEFGESACIFSPLIVLQSTDVCAAICEESNYVIFRFIVIHIKYTIKIKVCSIY